MFKYLYLIAKNDARLWKEVGAMATGYLHLPTPTPTYIIS
jgi:hypothetical protein